MMRSAREPDKLPTGNTLHAGQYILLRGLRVPASVASVLFWLAGFRAIALESQRNWACILRITGAFSQEMMHPVVRPASDGPSFGAAAPNGCAVKEAIMPAHGDAAPALNQEIGHVVQVQGGAHDLARFSIVQITPETAAALLAKRHATSKRNQAAVAAYAHAMRNGEWVLNGMPIILSRNGVLLDGLQRLYACVEAGKPFITVRRRTCRTTRCTPWTSSAAVPSPVCWRPAAFRTPPPSPALLAKLIRYEDGSLTRGTSTPPWSRMERALEANRDEIDTAVKFSFDHPARLLSESIRTPLSFMGLQVDRTAIRHFLDAIAHPDRFDADEPGVMVRRRLAEGRADPARRLPSVTLFALCIKALNDTLAGTRSEAYVWHDIARNRRTGEEFPRLQGYIGLRKSAGSSARGEVQARLVEEAEQALRDPGVYAMTVETITTERAEEYLAANRGNRNIVQSHVAAMARDIRNGHWMFNAQPICFSRSGRLLNGQHRLSAVLEAGQPIEVLVMRGLPEQAFETYDKQAKKPPAIDEMFEDFGDKALLSASAVLLWRRELRPANEPDARPTASEIRDGDRRTSATDADARLRAQADAVWPFVGTGLRGISGAARRCQPGPGVPGPVGDSSQPASRPCHPATARPADRSAEGGPEHTNRRNPRGLGPLPQAAGDSGLAQPHPRCGKSSLACRAAEVFRSSHAAWLAAALAV